jgi:two-component system, LytTR family, sensor kinase
MLVAMVWRERIVEGKPLLSRRGRLPLVTGVCGLVWNLGAFASFASQVAGVAPPPALLVAIAFGALGFLPAVVVHSLLEGRETAAGRRVTRLTIGASYGLSAAATVLHVLAALEGAAAPSRPALWLLTAGFTAITASLLLLTRNQPIGRRGIWVAALSVFAVSALHFGRHSGNEVWWVELVGHHASLPLALAILLQDYRFALADLFLKNAIALLLLMSLSLAIFSAALAPLLRWQDPGGGWDPRAVALFVAIWMATAVTFPTLRRVAAWVVDRAVLKRPDYTEVLARLNQNVTSAESEEGVTALVVDEIRNAFGISGARVIDDALPDGDSRLVIVGGELKAAALDSLGVLLLRVRTVEPPHPAIACGRLPAGRRLLSDDVGLLEAIARLAARRIDALRVAQERMQRNMREEAMQRLATEAEMRALRAQLNPHFLFNTLTTIGYLIQNAPPRAFDTLMRLTSVLRGVLRRRTTEFSTVGEEIDLITSYLEIEHARFEDRLCVEVDIEAAARPMRVPALLLQPLVENAVKHGIGPRGAGGNVRISAHVRGDRLHLVVEDSGMGFDPIATTAASGLGLRSVDERLRAHYRGLAALRVQSSAGRGTVVEIEMPAEPQPGLMRRTG